jgi:hypothetical protein
LASLIELALEIKYVLYPPEIERVSIVSNQPFMTQKEVKMHKKAEKCSSGRPFDRRKCKMYSVFNPDCSAARVSDLRKSINREK